MTVRLAYAPPCIVANGPYLRIQFYTRHGRRRFFGIGRADKTTPLQRNKLLDEFNRRRALNPDWPDEAPPDPDTLTVAGLVAQFLEAKASEHASGRIGARMLIDYRSACSHISPAISGATPLSALRPRDFGRLREALAERFGVTTLRNVMVRIRAVWSWGHGSKLVTDAEPWGHDFRLPQKRELRLARAAKPPPTFDAADIRALLRAADAAGSEFRPRDRVRVRAQFRAMILLGINCALGNTDVAGLSPGERGIVLDLPRAMLIYPRGKTGAARRAALWPETVAALRRVDLPMRTVQGNTWVRTDASRGGGGDGGQGVEAAQVLDPLAQAFGSLCRSAGVYRPRRGFYGLRHTFRTVVDALPDSRAVDLVMGHESPHMSSRYVHRVEDARLRSVASCVRSWLWGKGGEQASSRRRSKPGSEAARKTAIRTGKQGILRP